MAEILDYDDQEDLIQATTLQRFLNYIIDNIVIFAVLVIAVMVFSIVATEENEIYLNLAFVSCYVMYSFFFEYFFGKTIGKFITKTHVVNENGYKANFTKLLGRNFARLIPFDGLSFLFGPRGWHDSLSGTYVVKD